MSQEIITRRNLPHWYVPGAMHFVTFRLAGTLPRNVINDLQRQKEQLLVQPKPEAVSAAEHRQRVHKQLFALYDGYLDSNRQIDWLAQPRIAALVRQSLYHLHGDKYALLAYSIMPNHVHLLFLPLGVEISREDCARQDVGESEDGHSPLSGILHSLKSYTAHKANKILRRAGTFWQHESYDHWVRDDDELERIVEYINANAVRANLAPRPYEWIWSSAHDRFLVDGDMSGWLNLPMKDGSLLRIYG